MNQRVLQTQLKRCGFNIYIANNGEESLAIIRQSRLWQENESGHPLSLVLMDIEMPIMNGIEATQHIRRFEAEGLLSEHVPIIAITANARNEQMAMAKAAGMDEVVSKPFQVPDLIRKVENFLGPLELNTTKKGKGSLKRRWSG